MFRALAALSIIMMGIAWSSVETSKTVATQGLIHPTNFSPPKAGTVITTPLEPTRVPYTGLVVDTAGFPVSRGTSPKIYDETGRLIFGLIPDESGWVTGQNVELAMKIGVAGYSTSVQKAVADSRVGPLPLVVKIVNINAAPGNAFPKDVVVSKKDGDLILSANKGRNFLYYFRVVFITNPANL